MAREIVVLDRSKPAAADLSTSQFCAVVLNTSGQVALPTAGASIYGVLQNKPKSGQSATVRVYGLTKMLVGAGGVTAADTIKVTTAGAAVTATTGTFGIGQSEDTAAAGTLASVLLLPSGKQ